MTDDQQPDPMAERRRNSAGHYDAVDAAIARRPKAPTYIARTRAVDHGLEVCVDDGADTTITITATEPGRITIALGDTGATSASVDVDLFTAGLVDRALRAVAGIGAGHEAPITGSR